MIKNENELTRQSVNNGNIKKIYLENKQDNHFKFYILSKTKESKDTWLAQWGRIGAKPQSKIYSFDKLTMYDQYIAKLAKGYELINSDTFEQSIDQKVNETMEYLKSIGIDVDSLDDILL
jgi:predicted DNA-binding WGR domain protein